MSNWNSTANIERVLIAGAAGTATLLNSVKNELTELEDHVGTLEEEVLAFKGDKKEVRIFVDGAFDLFHFGHMNAFRLARSLGTYLVVGVNSDESITICKGGAPIMNDDERMAAVKGCRWVDQVVPNVPYVMNEEYINYIFETYDVDYVVHGDDPCIVDGKDVYATAKQAGKYQSIPRTEGISTTDIVGRILMLAADVNETNTPASALSGEHISSHSNFLTTTHKLRQFTASVKEPPKGARIVYIAGAWDLFHSGHVAMLEKAREYGDYVIAGVYNDHLVHGLRNATDTTAGDYPILSMSERVMSVSGCRYVDDVLLDAPYEVTHDMINHLNISVVLVNQPLVDGVLMSEECVRALPNHSIPVLTDTLTVIQFRVLDNLNDVIVVQRVLSQHDRFQKKYALKKKAELDFFTSKYDKSNK